MGKIFLTLLGCCLLGVFVYRADVRPKSFDDVDWKTVTAEQINALIKAKADVNAGNKAGITPLMAAAENNNDPAVTKALIRAGVDVNARYKNWGISPLMVAAAKNENPAVTEALIRAGADVNARDQAGFTPLMSAVAKNENPAVIEALVKAGADINVSDNEGKTAFDLAENPNIKGTPVYQKLQELKK
ncbi:MAG: ankyrin repeat domain-containing protein [Alphaproteobacteria bacterium]|nr:ankyrin repeat domain-containing protein [Alphaproteobacteria bacterium]